MMRNLSKMFSLVVMVVMLMFSSVANALTEIVIDSVYENADLTLNVGDTLFEYVGSDYECYGIVAENYGDSINIEYVVITDYTDYFWYGNSTTEGDVYDWTDKIPDYPYFKYIYNYSEFTLPVDGSVSDFVIGFENDEDEYFTLNLTFNHSTTTEVSSINSEKTNDITLYPNPVVSTLNIGGEFERALVFDMSGKVLVETTDNVIDMSEFKNGVYIVNVDGVSEKIIKK